MARDLVPRAALDRGQDLADEPTGDRADRPAALTANVLVMLPGRLVASLAIVELHPFHRAVRLETAHGAKHRGEVGLQSPLVEARGELVDRPAALRLLREQLDDRGPDVAWTPDRAILAITQVACETSAYGR
jgi:hypothetical protein